MCFGREFNSTYYFYCNNTQQQATNYNDVSCKTFEMFVNMGYKCKETSVFINNGIDMKFLKMRVLKIEIR